MTTTDDHPDIASQKLAASRRGTRATIIGIAVNVCLACIKIATGIFGSSYALIADGIESSSDIVTSTIVFFGLKFSVRPADRNHPYGHGKVESLVGLTVALALLAAAALIAVQSIGEIKTPHHSPAWFTLPVLLLVVLTKETLSRFVLANAAEMESGALKADAWHHRSDAITSAAAFVGIVVALIGGKGYEVADDWAALLACAVIAFNGFNLACAAANELMDHAPSEKLQSAIRETAENVDGVRRVEKILARKYGLGYFVDIHVEVDGNISVREGHRIAHAVKDALQRASLKIEDALVHVEPH